ncbi:hypothetical protein DPSP01_005486 [Paraphaeosphaeria sporulosa]
MTKRRPAKIGPGSVHLGESSPSQITSHRLSLHEIVISPSLKRELTSPYENGGTGYFPIVDSSFDGDTKVATILKEGEKKEHDAEAEPDPRKRQHHLSEALRIYNAGCNAKELYERISDVYGARIWLFDRSDWANVFFSAARVCTRFSKNPPVDRNGQTISPPQFKCNGSVLSAPDWDHQALHYLEQGRCRSLLHSISYGSAVTYKERWLLNKAVKNDMSVVVDAAMRSMRTATSHTPSPPIATNVALPEIVTEIEHLRESPASILQHPTTHSPSSGVLGDALSGSGHRSKIRERLSLQVSESMHSSNSSVTESPSSAISTSEIDEVLLARWKIQMRWRKAFLFARTGNPNLGDVLLGDIGKLIESIPQDTIVVEYALASTPPCGIMTIVAASDGIRVAEWKQTDAIAIQKSIEDLRKSMEFAQARPGSTRAYPFSISTMSRSADRPSVPQRNASALCQERLSNLLYDSVAGPVKPHLKGMKKLIIVPSGDLANVPWSIFFNLPITVVPSLNIWNRLQTQAASAGKRHPKISVVSNAPIDHEKKRKNLPAIRDIPYSRMEALAIARAHHKGMSPFIADGKDREDFKEETKGTQILHLCAHSTFDPKFPSNSSIQLFHEPLTMSDWRELSISANLVVFSSCLSGISKAYDSGSAIGFAHTLLATGTGAFIGSLWPVNDAATFLLMIMFYEELRKSSPPADALFAAQMRMRYLTEGDLLDIIDEVQQHFLHGDADEFVLEPMDLIEELKEQKVMELREERYWAAFVLTGYGSRELYHHSVGVHEGN